MSRKGPDQSGRGNEEFSEHPIVDIEGVKDAARTQYRSERNDLMGIGEEKFASEEAMAAVERRDTAVLLMEFEYPGSKVIPVPEKMKGKDFLQYPYVTDALGIDGYRKDLPAAFPGIAKLDVGRGDYLVISPDKKDLRVVKAGLEFGAVAVKGEKTFVRDEKMWAKVSGEAEKTKIAELLKKVDYEIDDDSNVVVRFKSREAERKVTLPDIFNSEAIKVNGKLAIKVPERGGQYYYLSKGGKIGLERALVLNGTKVREDLSDDEQKLAQDALERLQGTRDV